MTPLTVSCWQDRFARPSASALLDGVEPLAGERMRRLREGLLSVPGVVEEVVWRGLPMRWTLRLGRAGAGDRECAFLVACPSRPAVCVALTSSELELAKASKMGRVVREGIAAAKVVHDVAWAEWELGSDAALEDLLALGRARVGAAVDGAAERG